MSGRRRRLLIGYFLFPLLIPSVAQAGMAMATAADIGRAFTLSNLTRERLEIISFFVLLILLCAAVIRWIWNGLRKDFSFLPRLSYGRALGIVTIWGLFFMLIMTMIAGARELMTPGAWEKKGLLYELAQQPPPPIQEQITARVEAMERLGKALVPEADNYGNRYRANASRLPDDIWVVPGTAGKRYLRTTGASGDIIYEPEEVGPERLVLELGSRFYRIRWLPASEITRLVKGERR